MDIVLSNEEARVLGSLIEKELSFGKRPDQRLQPEIQSRTGGLLFGADGGRGC
jgi:hypothetical protein